MEIRNTKFRIAVTSGCGEERGIARGHKSFNSICNVLFLKKKKKTRPKTNIVNIKIKLNGG